MPAGSTLVRAYLFSHSSSQRDRPPVVMNGTSPLYFALVYSLVDI
jgi:hypothetical protein